MTTTQDSRPEILDMERGIFAEQRRDRHKALFSIWALRVFWLALFLGVWSLASHRGIIDPLFISSPEDVGRAFVDQLTDRAFWVDVQSTISGAMLGLLVGASLGVLSGVILSRSEVLNRAVAPFVTLLNSLPRPALAPIFILWFGLGMVPKALVAASMVYFVLLTNTTSALRGIDHDIDQLSRSMSMSPWQRFVKIEFPSALPAIVGGLRLAAVYSVLGAVLSEMVGAYTGLGQRLVTLTNNFQVAESFAVILAMGLMSMLLDAGISLFQKVVEKRA
ncbi:ABC transporter permease [Nocardia australiensis]|uniref:ABC transporter permease n=1 Tax=Nocardia australiensis TaxID=2887191 RepID=UPI001D14F950|nr:ABC transporter permease [Nocardia australiensis]